TTCRRSGKLIPPTSSTTSPPSLSRCWTGERASPDCEPARPASIATATNRELNILRTALLMNAACLAGAAAAQTGSETPLYVAEFHCESTPPLRDASPHRWNGWGPTVTNTRFQPAEAGGITVADIPNLRLAWAYGLPREQQARGQPSVIGGRLFVGSQAGAIYALDAKTGCTHWQFFPEAGIRSANSVGPHRFPHGRDGYAVYFVDAQGWVYALDADSG